ncbi:MAG TPA: Mur ligase domain-containing protein [Thermoleophilaceae bacterium]|nr:Mur ligase domain-containing protein [Thermoleophilaceae bacterium]
MDTEPFANRQLHFIGIGGAGMSGLALVAAELGATVTGSDRADSTYTDKLRAAGIEPVIGHAAANLPAGAEVVVSTAIPPENPELVAAHTAGATVIHRGQLLGELTRLKKAIAIAGTHGKTTTCGMVAHVLRATGRDPAFVIGGELRSAGTNAAWGAGDWIVAEADESDRSFLQLARDVAVVTNVELDHHATYHSLADLQATFAEFIAPANLCIAWHPAAQALAIDPTTLAEPQASLAAADSAAGDEGPSSDSQAERAFVSHGVPPTPNLQTYGIDTGDLTAQNVTLRPMGSHFTVDGVPVELNVPGEHNILNALAALAACRAAGVELAEAAPAIAGFGGAGRRFEERGATATGAQVYDDYAHHPTEVRATLEAARTLDARRIVACFQPHLFSRTRELAREFGRALALADVVVVVDVYPARERAEDFPGVSGLLVAEAAADAAPGRPVVWAPSFDDAERRLRGELGPGDVLLTLGAGNIDALATRLTAGDAGSGSPASARDDADGDPPPLRAEDLA